jgi:hypothetical protein
MTHSVAHPMANKVQQEEEARTRGTPVTLDSFKQWKAKFDKEIAEIKAKEEEEKLKALTAKEREEYRRAQGRPSGTRSRPQHVEGTV